MHLADSAVDVRKALGDVSGNAQALGEGKGRIGLQPLVQRAGHERVHQARGLVMGEAEELDQPRVRKPMEHAPLGLELHCR